MGKDGALVSPQPPMKDTHFAATFAFMVFSSLSLVFGLVVFFLCTRGSAKFQCAGGCHVIDVGVAVLALELDNVAALVDGMPLLFKGTEKVEVVGEKVENEALDIWTTPDGEARDQSQAR